MIRPLVVGIIVGTIVAVAVMFLMSLVITVAGLSDKVATPLSALAAGAGALAAGFATGKLFGKRMLFMGLLSAAALYLIVMFIALAVSPGGFSVLSFTRLAIMAVAGMVGGLWAGREGGRRRKVI